MFSLAEVYSNNRYRQQQYSVFKITLLQIIYKLFYIVKSLIIGVLAGIQKPNTIPKLSKGKNMKTIKAIAVRVSSLALVLSFGGCSAFNLVYTGNSSTTGQDFRNSDFEISKKAENVIEKGKSYVLVAGQGITMEVINGKVTLVGYVKEDNLGKVVLEVRPGLHTYVGFSSCDAYIATVDVKEGYAYVLGISAIGKKLMDYCRGQEIFIRHKDKTAEGFMNYYSNYALVPENISKAQQIIDESRMQIQYENFMKNIEDKREMMKLHVTTDQGILVK